jgi:hypothetical protein
MYSEWFSGVYCILETAWRLQSRLNTGVTAEALCLCGVVTLLQPSDGQSDETYLYLSAVGAIIVTMESIGLKILEFSHIWNLIYATQTIFLYVLIYFTNLAKPQIQFKALEPSLSIEISF